MFVRLTGCPLRCQYCDTEYAFHGGQRMSVDQILEEVRTLGARRVCVTGGEPLAQPEVHALLTQLADEGLGVSLETSGALDIGEVDPRVVRVVDFKTPGSGEVSRNLWANVDLLTAQDQVKFVLCDRQDYDWARFRCDEYGLTGKVSEVLFSPSFEELTPRELAGWVLADGLDVRVQVQQHKLIWGNEPGR